MTIAINLLNDVRQRRGGDKARKPVKQKRARKSAQKADAPAINHNVALVFDDASQQTVFALYEGKTVRVARTSTSNIRTQLAEAFSAYGLADSTGGVVAAQFLTCAPLFSEDTRVLPISPDSLPFTGDDLILAVADAHHNNLTGSDKQPVFPDATRDAAQTWDIAPTPLGFLTVTTAARGALDDVAGRIATDVLAYAPDSQSADEDLYLDFRCETYVRAVLRAHLSAAIAEEITPDEHQLSALIVFTGRGAAVGLWSPKRGLFVEDAEPFSVGDAELDEGVLANLVEHALENLLLRLSPSALEAYGFRGVHRVWWTASPVVLPQVFAQMSNFESDYAARYAGTLAVAEKLNIVKVGERPSESLEEMAARGLLLSSNQEACKLVPPINLAYGVLEQADDILSTRQEKDRQDEAALRRRVQVCAIIPFLIALGLVFGGYVSTLMTSYSLDKSLAKEKEEQARLAPVAERRRAATQVLDWVSAYLTQVTELRRRQPASLSLLAALDERYPVAEDSTFTVKYLEATSDGLVQIQGLTKRDDAISALITKLEFSPTDAKGRKLFERPVYELRKPQVGGINLPSLPGTQGLSPLTVQSQRPDVSAWTVRVVYTPLQRESVLTPKAAPTPPGAPPAPK